MTSQAEQICDSQIDIKDKLKLKICDGLSRKLPRADGAVYACSGGRDPKDVPLNVLVASWVQLVLHNTNAAECPVLAGVRV